MMHFLVPFVEISLIACMLYWLLSFFWNTRTMDLMLGLASLLCLLGAVTWLRLPVLQKMAFFLGNAAALALLVIFQPELRLALAKLSMKGKKFKEITEFDRFLDSLAQSVYRLSDKRIGALVVLENQDALDEYAHKGVMLNAQFSSELLETIFSANTPLHDGAVIVRGTTILSAATILPLADESSQLSKSKGTRHRAALGMSQQTSSVVVVVSEETGWVSVAREGIITSVKIDRFKGIIRSVFTPPKTVSPNKEDVFHAMKTRIVDMWQLCKDYWTKWI